MPSTASQRLRVELQALGENSLVWGAPKLNDALQRLEEAIAGVESISTSGGTTTLTSANYSTDQARKAVLVFSGALASNATVIVPNVEKTYLAVNNTTGTYSLTVKTAAGTGYALRSGANWVYCDGTNVNGAVPRLDQAPLASASVDLNSQRITNLGTPSASTDAATKAYVDAAVSTTPTQNLATSAGTALAPTYSWATDSNTGLYLVGSDSLGLSAGGSVRATVSSAGLNVAGALAVSGAASVGAGLGVTGAATVGSTLAVSGALTAASVASSGAVSGTTLAASGAATLSGTLGVTGATTLGGTLAVTGASTHTSGTFSTTLGVTGATTLGSTLAVTGAATLSSTLGVTGAVTAGGVVQGPAGSVSAPAHSFSTDTNTGIYSGGADILRLATGGADRVEVSAAGNVGIGIAPTASSSFKVLHVSGTDGSILDLTGAAGTPHGRVASNVSTTHVYLENRHATGDLVFGAGSGTERSRLTAAGYLLHGQASSTVPGFSNTTTGSSLHPDGRLFLSAPSGSFSNWNINADGALISFCRSGTAVGGVAVTTTTTAFNTSSDYRLKTGIEPLTGAVDRLAALQPKRFRFKTQAANAPKIDGFLAHEVTAAVPEAVTGGKDAATMQQLDLSKLVPLLVGAVQELAVRVTAAEATIKTKKDK